MAKPIPMTALNPMPIAKMMIIIEAMTEAQPSILTVQWTTFHDLTPTLGQRALTTHLSHSGFLAIQVFLP